MKCIHCYREIDDGLKFCPKCGFKQPDDREAYEQEHPELADAVPEDEILVKVEQHNDVPRTAMTRDEFVQQLASDPHCYNIVSFADQGLATYGLVEQDAINTWYAKCAEFIGDKQWFYPYFVKLLSQQPEKARFLLHSQVANDLNLALPPQNPVARPATQQQAVTPQLAIPVTPRQQVPQQQSVRPAQRAIRAGNDHPSHRNDLAPAKVYHNNGNNPSPRPRPQKNKDNNNSYLYAIICLLLLLIIGIGIYLFTKDGNGKASAMGDPAQDSIGSYEYEELASIPQDMYMSEEAVPDSVDATEGGDYEDVTYSEFGSEDISPKLTYAQDNGRVIDGKSAQINTTWLEHFVNDGLRIHVDMQTSNLLNHQVEVVCFFWFKDGRKVISTDDNYRAPDKQIATSIKVTPGYQECTYNDLQLWIPYSQIKEARDRKILKCRVEVFYNNQCLATGNYMNFACWRE